MPRVIIVAILALTFASSATVAKQYEVLAGERGNRVVFVSKAPVESFEGKTDQVSGRFDIDPTRLGDSVRVEIEVDLASLDTGIGLRNKHMRENHLETDRFPKAVFTAGRILSSSASSLAEGQSTRVRLAGLMSLHGVTREVEYDVELSMDQAGMLAVMSEFTVKLSDYDIKRPKFLIMKLADEQVVKVSLIAHPISEGGK
jgi:polyisoprenoid-binding protein YceI